MVFFALTSIILLSRTTLTSSQPLLSPSNDTHSERMAELVEIQRKTLSYFNSLRIGRDGFQFSLIMESVLLAQTFALVDYVRGWARSTEEDDNYRWGMLRFARLSTAYRIAFFALSRFEFVAHGVGAAVPPPTDTQIYALAAELNTQIFTAARYFRSELASGEEWEQPIRDGILSFSNFEFDVSYRRNAMGESTFHLFLLSSRSIRYADNGEQMYVPQRIRNDSHGDLSNAEIAQLTTRPLPMQPYANYVNEMNTLYLAQSSVLELTRQLMNQGWWSVSENLLVSEFVRINVRDILHEARRSYSSNTHVDAGLLYLSQYVFCTHLFTFLTAQFCTISGIRVRVASEITSNVRIARRDALVHEQHQQLQQNAQELSRYVRCVTDYHTVLRNAYRRLRRVPVQIQYQLNRPDIGVFIRHPYSVYRPVQTHLNYENFTQNNFM